MIKAYTDINQSKKLAEILPHKTADNTHERVVISGCNLGMPEEQQYIHRDTPFTYFSGVGVPCWSLAALLSVLNCPDLLQTPEGTWLIRVWYKNYPYSVGGYNNPIDACVAIIEKLHELKLL